ncbi:EAL domain-containing protein [Pseudohongiella acticola]|nr:GGDEF domain-containing protein [Pseudohongiella acticola]
MVCAALMSPGGLFVSVETVDAEFWVRSTGLFGGGLLGGLLQRLISWLQSELYVAQHHVRGTGLPNEKATIKYLEKVLKSASLDTQELDLLNVRVNNLDHIRQSADKETTNQLIRALAEQLKARLGEGAHVSQLSDNELLGIQVGQDLDASSMQKLVEELLAKPVSINGKDYQLTASAGLHRKGRHDTENNPQALVDQAAKMASAAQADKQSLKSSGKNEAIHDFGGDADGAELRAAMDKHEFSLFYEPRLNTRTGYFSALQGIVHWHHPQKGDLLLDDFKSMLKDPASVQGLCGWMLKLAFADADEWARHNYQFRITVDVTINDRLCAPALAYALAESSKRKFKPGWLGIEVSEQSLRAADAKSTNYLEKLKKNEVSIIVSNFGVGGTNVQDLFMMSVDAIKFSPKIIKTALLHTEKRRELASTIKLIHSRGLLSIADGVATSDGLKMLRALECAELQGPMISKALPKVSIPWARLRV